MQQSALALAISDWQKQQPAAGCALLVRHGATSWNVERRIQGRTDTVLNESGILQAQQVAEALVQLPLRPAVVYTSPLQRARVTACTIAEELAVPLVVNADLIERTYGAFESLTNDDIQRRFTAQERLEERIPGLETYSQLQKRAKSIIEQLYAQESGRLFVVVSHGGLLNAFLTSASGGQIGTRKTSLANGSISVVWQQHGAWQYRVNIGEHLTEHIPQSLSD